MSTIVISQPMYFPWVGLFEQIRLADTYVHYNDVQMPLGRSFSSRVQVKLSQGTVWMTVPIKRKAGQLIDEVEVDESQPWREHHFILLQQAFMAAPYRADALKIAKAVLGQREIRLSKICMNSIELVCNYLDLRPTFLSSRLLQVPGRSTERLSSIIKKLEGSRYVTGHGAIKYLDHESLEREGIQTFYLDYACKPYPQISEPFTPYVTVLDAIANVGPDARNLIVSPAIPWRTFIETER